MPHTPMEVEVDLSDSHLNSHFHEPDTSNSGIYDDASDENFPKSSGTTTTDSPKRKKLISAVKNAFDDMKKKGMNKSGNGSSAINSNNKSSSSFRGLREMVMSKSLINNKSKTTKSDPEPVEPPPQQHHDEDFSSIYEKEEKAPDSEEEEEEEEDESALPPAPPTQPSSSTFQFLKMNTTTNSSKLNISAKDASALNVLKFKTPTREMLEEKEEVMFQDESILKTNNNEQQSSSTLDLQTGEGKKGTGKKLLEKAKSVKDLIDLKVEKRRLKKVMRWDSTQVGEWLDCLGLGAYKETFLENGVDGYALLMSLNSQLVATHLHITNHNHLKSFECGLDDLISRRVSDPKTYTWSLENVLKWLEERGLGMLHATFTDNAIHGGVLFRATKQDFAAVGVDNPLVLSSLQACIARARAVGCVRVNSENVLDWGPNDVNAWLASINLKHLQAKFKANGLLNGAALLSLDVDLMTTYLGVTEIQAMVLQRGVRKLRKKHNTRKRREFFNWLSNALFITSKVTSNSSSASLKQRPSQNPLSKTKAAKMSNEEPSLLKQRKSSLNNIPISLVRDGNEAKENSQIVKE